MVVVEGGRERERERERERRASRDGDTVGKYIYR